jgi:hypothetical protein
MIYGVSDSSIYLLCTAYCTVCYCVNHRYPAQLVAIGVIMVALLIQTVHCVYLVATALALAMLR